MQRARCYLLGESAVVLELEPPMTLASQRRISGLALRLKHHDAVREVIPGMNNLTVWLSYPQHAALDAIEQLQAWWEESESIPTEPREVAIPVVYGGEDGPDLQWVADKVGMTPRQVVERHSAAVYTVYFLGFQPGFPYLGGLPETLHVPRLDKPRLQVAAGSVGIGGSQTGIYPLATPGGWQLIGRTVLSLFDATASVPALLQPGDTLRFVPRPEGVC